MGAPTLTDMTALPDVISAYYDAAARGDLDDVIACFAPTAQVVDENQSYHGVAEIRRWRETGASRFSYTTEITGSEHAGADQYVVMTHLEGDFPGGVVDLAQRFTVTGDRISELLI